MLTKTPISLVTKVAGPDMVQVTSVAPPWLAKVYSATLELLKGRRKSSFICTLLWASAVVISMRPAPTFLLPFHS